MKSNIISQSQQHQQQQPQTKVHQYHNQINSKSGLSLDQNRQKPRSTSRQKPSTPQMQGKFASSSSKRTSDFTQRRSSPLHSSFPQKRKFHQSVSLPQAANIQSIHNVTSANSQTNAITNYSSNTDNYAQLQSRTYMSTNSAASQSDSKEKFQLFCRKHEKPIEKICTKIGCEQQQSVLCAQCYFDNQQHIGMHKEHMFNFADFIAVCKSFSLRFRDDCIFGNKPLSMLLMKLEKYVMKYKFHVKNEEERIDEDFDLLIRSFKGQMEDLKQRLKGKLNIGLEKVQDMAKNLKSKMFDIQSEKQSNIDINNDFDDFLNNLKEISAQQAPSQNYNFKKLFHNISPLLTRYKKQIKKLIDKTNNLNNANVVINTEQSETLSCLTGLTGGSYLSLYFVNQPHLAPIKDMFFDFKELSENKPYYKNKGEGWRVYDDALADIKRIYHDFSDNLSLFIEQPNIKLTFDFNKEKLQELTDPEKPEINELQFIQKTDHITLKGDQPMKYIEFIKSVNTNHKSGIFALVIVDDDTYVTGSVDRKVKVFRMKDHKFIKELKFETDITALSTLKRQDGSIMVLVGLYGGFAVLNQGFEILKIMEGEHDSSVTCIVGLNDHETVITASSDPKIVVWNAFNGDIPNRKYFDHKDTIYSLELFPCGKFLASGGRDRSIKIWKLQYYKESYKNSALEKMILDTNIQDAHSTDITSIKSSKLCQGFLLSGSANGEIKIWELLDATCVKTIKNISGWIYKFIIFESPQDPQIEQLFNKQENVISHVAHISVFKQKNTILPKKSQYYSNNQEQQISIKNPREISLIIDPKKKLKRQKYLEQLKKIQFLTASFDGSLKLWNATSEAPLDSQKSRNSFDCFPFGAVTAFQKDNERRIHIFTTGNKDDSCINIWNVN